MPACRGKRERSERGRHDVDGQAEKPSERERVSQGSRWAARDIDERPERVSFSFVVPQSRDAAASGNACPVNACRIPDNQ